jgi:small subunit ribosomal protein S6
MQKAYELMVLLHPDLEIDVETPIAKVEGLVQAAGGRVTKRDNWGKKRLAYKIAKQEFAVYVYFEIAMEPSQVRELEKTILITEEIIRYILVVHEEAPVRVAKKVTEDDKKSDEPKKEVAKDDKVVATEEAN